MRQTIKEGDITWVDIQNPTKQDIDYLRSNFSFHELVLDELFVPAWRPKLEVFPDHLFLILYYPVWSKERKETRPRELDILITPNALITVHYNSILPIKSLFDKCNLYPDARRTYMSKGTGFLLFFLLSTFWKNALLKLTRVNIKIDQIEEKIFQGEEQAQVAEISFAKTDVLNFWRIIDPQGEILRELKKEGGKFFGQELTPYFTDILDNYNQAHHELATYQETLRSLEETNNSLLTAKTNEIMRVLTIFATIMLPLTLVASVFSMNTIIPFANNPKAFWVILVSMAIGLLLMFGYFKKKKWI